MIARNTFFAAAALVAAFGSTALATGPAAAASFDGLEVRYSDLNLSSPIGQAALDRRIAFAADQVCGDGWTDVLLMQRIARKCQADTIAAARAQRDAIVGGERLASLVVRRAAG